MSWQLASFALVALALVLAGWWYERSRPSAKLLALVATLAALAALGRDAFAAVPDVKPITAIVLVAGVAFGAGPGFAVGAVAALASNVLLGEGPWTPWQMLGWGAVGAIGGGLGAISGRRLPPLALALAAAAAAEVFNLVLDFYTWTGTGNHTLAGFGIVLGSAATFDVTHVVASFAFGLAFGAVLLRMLLRVRARLQVSWRVGEPVGLGLALVALSIGVTAALAGTAAPARATAVAASASSVAPAHDIASAAAYLAGAEDSNGGFGSAPGQASSELYSAWAAIALAAAGRDPLTVRRSGHDVLDALRAEAGSLEGAGDLERTILALRACGASVQSLPGGDPVVRLLRYRRRDGSFSDLSNLTAFAILALRAAGEGGSSPAINAGAGWLAAQQESNGGFGFGSRSESSGADIDDTGAVLEALAAAGRGGSGSARRAVAFLLAAQNPDGGFPQQAGGESNAQSTAWAIQGLDAVGRNVASVKRGGSRSPLGYLESLITANGSVRYSRTAAQTPVWVTAEALPALAGRALPVGPVFHVVTASRPR